MALIDTLILDVGEHFDAEMKIITAAGFPGAAAHAEIHRDLLERAQHLQPRPSCCYTATSGSRRGLQFASNEIKLISL